MKTLEEQKAFVAKLNLTDDVFFRHVFKDRAAAEEVVRVLLGKPRLRVVESNTQQEIHSLDTRSVVLDLYCEDDEGNRIAVEMQNANDNDCLQRTRYIRSLVTGACLKKGTGYGKLPDVYTVFITTFDAFGLGDTTYEVERKLRKHGTAVPNGEHELYVNTVNDDGSSIARLMRYFAHSTTEGDVMFAALSDRVRNCKESPKEARSMYGIVEQLETKAREEGIRYGVKQGIEQGIEQGVKQGIEQGIEKERLSGLRNLMANLGCPLERAMDLMGIPAEDRKNIVPVLG